MRVIAFGKQGTARAWEDAGVGATFLESGVARRTVASGVGVPVLTRVTLEARVPHGGFSSYGLLGLSFAPGSGSEGLTLEVPWSDGEGPLWKDSLARAPETPRCGLLKEFAGAVLNALEATAARTVAPGVLRVTEAVQGDIGSNSRFMSGLARVALGILLKGPPSEEELRQGLEQALIPG